jgi:hypothetical protein
MLCICQITPFEGKSKQQKICGNWQEMLPKNAGSCINNNDVFTGTGQHISPYNKVFNNNNNNI